MRYVNSYSTLAQFGKDLLENTSIEEGLPMIASYAKEVIDADRCSIYIYNSQKNLVWTTLADGIEKLTLDADKGIVGQTIKERKPIKVNEPYHDENFNAKIDLETGYTTENIASVPIFDSSRKIIGVMQLLNKHSGAFDNEDLKFMIFFAHYISGYLELSILFSDNKGHA